MTTTGTTEKQQSYLDSTMADPNQQTYLDEPPAYDLKEVSSADRKEIMAESRSITSAYSDATTVAPPSNFVGSKTLLINSRGIRLLRFPIPSRETEVAITTKSGDLAYLSTRPKWTSGNAILTNTSGKELIASEYQFGPNRDAKLKLLAGRGKDEIEGVVGEIQAKSKWTSRQQEFQLPTGGTFVWQYVREVDPSPSNEKGKKRTFLVLNIPVAQPSSPITTESKGKEKKPKKQEMRRVAQLVRNEESRTPGTKRCDAGNGGELVIDEAALEVAGFGEEIIVATCLMMLKKEIDRRRLMQAMMIAGAASGGS